MTVDISTARTGDAGADSEEEDPPPGVLASALFGFITGVEISCRNFLFAGFLFIGPLVAGVALGTTVLLLSTALMATALALRSRVACAVGAAQHASMAVLLPAFGWVMTEPGLGDAERVATMLGIMGAGAFASGLLQWLMGRFRLGWIAALLPYPVAAGFLASSGCLLLLWSIEVLAVAEGRGLWSMVTGGGAPVNLALATFLGIAFLVLAYRFRLSVLVAICLLFYLAAFYAVLWALGIDSGQARELHLLPQQVAPGAAIGPSLDLYGLVDLALLQRAAPLIAASVVMNVAGTMLNLNAVEVAMRRPVSMDHELEVTGLTNVVIGSFGGAAAFMTSGNSLMANRMRVGGPVLGLTIAAVALASALVSDRIGPFLPLSLASGLLIFIGGSMMYDWGLTVRRRLPAQDWLVVLLIVALTIVAGIMTAILAGLAISILTFVVSYARLPVIRRAGTGQRERSTVDRAPEDEAVLFQRGGETAILKLQGYLFFGSADRVLQHVRGALERDRLRHVVIDFRDVTGLDSAACVVFLKLRYLARAAGATVILSAVSADAHGRLVRAGYRERLADGSPAFRPSLDAALEWCEDRSLAEAADQGAAGGGLARALAGAGGSPGADAELRGMLERVEVPAGAVIIRAGDRSTDVFLVDAGRLSVRLTGPDGAPIRVRSVLPGAVVGEAARYLGDMRTADVVADEASVLYRLRAETFDRLERDAPALAAALHRMLARHLAEKLSKTNAVVSGMMS